MNEVSRKQTIIEKIQSNVDEMEALFKSSGLKALYGNAVSFRIEPNVNPVVHIGYYNDENEYQSQVFKSPDSDPMKAIHKAKNWIARIPAKEALEKQAFIKATAALIEMGKKIGVDVAFVNPLEVMMKQLSENAITYNPFDNTGRDDDLPF